MNNRISDPNPQQDPSLQAPRSFVPPIKRVPRKTDIFEASGIEYIDYKEVEVLKRYINEEGKILPRRITGLSAKHQRQLTKAIKRARHLALLPFVAESVR